MESPRRRWLVPLSKLPVRSDCGSSAIERRAWQGWQTASRAQIKEPLADFQTQRSGWIEGLALQTPPRSMAAIHRQVTAIAKEQGWKPPSYDRVRHIIKYLDPALVTMAHQGAAAYREAFDLLYRRESPQANAMWQADHTPLDVLLLDEAGKPAKPWLTAIEDDYSRAIVGYRLSFQEATALTTALTLRTAIWRKEDPRWHACGIPTVFYSDHGPDFTSKHLEQVAADLPMELIFSQVSIPRGRGKIERFFRSVERLLFQDVPGSAPEGSTGVKATLTLPVFEQHFRTWLLEDYHQRIHVETSCRCPRRRRAFFSSNAGVTGSPPTPMILQIRRRLRPSFASHKATCV